MLEKTKKLIDSYFQGKISSQNLISNLRGLGENNETLYREYFNLTGTMYCNECGREEKYTGFKKGFTCQNKCEYQKKLKKMNDEEIINFIKTLDLKGCRFSIKKMEDRLKNIFSNKTGKELKYCVLNDVFETPTCQITGCNNKQKFSVTDNVYSGGCCLSHITLVKGRKWSEGSKNKLSLSLLKFYVTFPTEKLKERNLKQSITKQEKNKNLEYKSLTNKKREDTLIIKYGHSNCSQIEEVKEKKKETLSNNFSVSNPFSINKEKSISKMRATNENSGRWVIRENRNNYEIYFNAASFKHGFETNNENEKKLLAEYGVFNSKNNIKGCVRDHLLSRRYGFDNNIPVWIISHPANCEIILHSENLNRARINDDLITLEELLERIENWNI